MEKLSTFGKILSRTQLKNVKGALAQSTCYSNTMSDGQLYLECVNEDGSFSYYDVLGKEISCSDIN